MNTNIQSAIEFNDQGEILFYSDGKLICKEKYKFLRKQNDDGALYMQLKIKGNGTESWKIDEKLDIFASSDGMYLAVDRFPFPAIEMTETYRKEYRSGINYFTKE